MKFRATFAVPQVDFRKYQVTLKREMSEKIYRAARKWLEAALTSHPIPVWSGASQATFLKLAATVNYSLFINPKVIDRMGFGQARSAGYLDRGDSVPTSYTFTYKTDLPWLLWNEHNNANVNPDPTLLDSLKNPGPYNFQLHAYDAFKQFADTVRLPEPTFKIKKLKV